LPGNYFARATIRRKLIRLPPSQNPQPQRRAEFSHRLLNLIRHMPTQADKRRHTRQSMGKNGKTPFKTCQKCHHQPAHPTQRQKRRLNPTQGFARLQGSKLIEAESVDAEFLANFAALPVQTEHLKLKT
jgi:hypothetical protein